MKLGSVFLIAFPAVKKHLLMAFSSFTCCG